MVAVVTAAATGLQVTIQVLLALLVLLAQIDR